MRVGVIACIVAVLVARAAYAGEEPETEAGRALFAEGSEAFARGDFATASDAFKRGYDEEPWSGFLFAWAQAERSGGSCPAAIELYSRFIATDPPEDARKHALGWIEVCGGKYVPPKPPPPPEPIEPERVEPPPPPEPPRDDGPRFRHKLALGLGVASIASAAVAVRFYTWSRRDAETSLRVSPYAETARVYERSTSRLTIARVSAGLAGALAVGAALRLVLNRPGQAGVDIALSPHGELVVAGTF